MHIENNPAHATPSRTFAMRVAVQAQAENPAAPDSADAPKAESETAKASPVTGVSRNTLSPDVLETLIGAQETDAADADPYEGILNGGDRYHLERIVNDPAYAASQADLYGTGYRLAAINLSDDGIDELSARNLKMMERERELRNSLYEERKASGASPAQIYADILKFQAADSAFNTHNDRVFELPEGDTARRLQAQHDYLRHLIDRKAAAS